MAYSLLFNRCDSNVRTSQLQRTLFNPTLLERFASKVLGISVAPFTESSWKEEDNTEFPFSVGSYHPKCCSNESAGGNVWSASEDVSPSRMFDHEDEWQSDEEVEGFLQNANQLSAATTQAALDVVNITKTKVLTKCQSMGQSGCSDPGEELAKLPQDISDVPQSLSQDTSDVTQDAGTSTISPTNVSGCTYQMPKGSGRIIVIPDQNVKAKSGTKGSTTLLEDIGKLNEKASRVGLHLFEDRVFIAEDKAEAQKLLHFNTSKNPIKSRMFPLVGGVVKIVDNALSMFRAAFNLCMWKDPMLSFWFSLFLFCLMIVLCLFPWRLFFFVGGLFGLGPQNYFLAVSYDKKLASRPKANPAKGNSGLAHQVSMSNEDVSKSPLLFRDNVQMKPDGKHREVIVPGEDCVFRFNRFYDWPTDPATTVIKKGV